MGTVTGDRPQGKTKLRIRNPLGNLIVIDGRHLEIESLQILADGDHAREKDIDDVITRGEGHAPGRIREIVMLAGTGTINRIAIIRQGPVMKGLIGIGATDTIAQTAIATTTYVPMTVLKFKLLIPSYPIAAMRPTVFKETVMKKLRTRLINRHCL